jgi:hypothetical protein
MMARKINDEVLLSMLKEGKMQKEIAAYFHVSPVSVCKRLKRLLPGPETILDKHELTDREKSFCISKAQGLTNTQAALSSYEAGSMQSAKVIGSQLMAKPEIKMAIDELMEYHGIGRSYRIKRLRYLIDHQDPNIVHKGLDMSYKLDGSYKSDDNEGTTYNFTQVNIDLSNGK